MFHKLSFNFIYIFIFTFSLNINAQESDFTDLPPPNYPIIKDDLSRSRTNKLFNSKIQLNPVKGSEVVYVEKNNSALINLTNLGDIKNDIEFFIPKKHLNLIKEGVQEEDGKGYRIFAGNNVGQTQVLVYEKSSRIAGKKYSGRLLKVIYVNVNNQDIISKLRQIELLLGDVEGLELSIVGDVIVAEGNVIVPDDLYRVDLILDQKAGVTDKFKVINMVGISPLALQMIAKRVEEEVNGGPNRPKDIRVKVQNNQIQMSGLVDRLADRQLAEKTCRNYFLPRLKKSSKRLETPTVEDTCVANISIRQPAAKNPDAMFVVRVDFVSLSRDYVKGFDFRWSPGISEDPNNQITYAKDASSAVGSIVSSIGATISNLFPKLNTLAKHGHARILKTAVLMAHEGFEKSGGEGQPEVTETINLGYVTRDENGNPVSQSQPVTTSIKLGSVRSVGNLIQLDVVASTSELLQVNSEAPPNTQTNTIKSGVLVKNGDSAAIGGLITNRRSISTNRKPGSDEGTNFSLFDIGRGHQFNDSKNQFVIFVTPKRVRSLDEQTKILKQKFRLRK